MYLDRAFFAADPVTVARGLVGAVLEVTHADGSVLSGRLVEVEAYGGRDDPASHAAGGSTPRSAIMFGPPGLAYVYFVYGMHHCLNVVTGPADRGEAVLIRAGEPLDGIETMRRLRGLVDREPRPGEIAGGPARLCQALAIDRTLNGVPFGAGELNLVRGPSIEDRDVARSPRVGVDYAGQAAAWPLRFSIRGNPHVSRPRPPSS